MSGRTFTFTAEVGGEQMEKTITVKNETWNERVARQYAGYWIANNYPPVDNETIDMNDIEYQQEEP